MGVDLHVMLQLQKRLIINQIKMIVYWLVIVTTTTTVAVVPSWRLTVAKNMVTAILMCAATATTAAIDGMLFNGRRE